MNKNRKQKGKVKMSNKEDYNDGNEYKFDNIEVDKDTHKKVKKKAEQV